MPQQTRSPRFPSVPLAARSLLSTRALKPSSLLATARTPWIQHIAARARRRSCSPLALAARRAMDLVPADSLSEEVVPDSTSESQQPSSDSDMVPDSIEVVPDSIEMVPDSEMMPDSLPPGAFICGRHRLIIER